jgi:hypothetical protein
MSSERAGPKVRDGAAVTAVEVMRWLRRETGIESTGLSERLIGFDIIVGEPEERTAPLAKAASPVAWMKQQRLP